MIAVRANIKMLKLILNAVVALKKSILEIQFVQKKTVYFSFNKSNCFVKNCCNIKTFIFKYISIVYPFIALLQSLAQPHLLQKLKKKNRFKKQFLKQKCGKYSNKSYITRTKLDPRSQYL